MVVNPETPQFLNMLGYKFPDTKSWIDEISFTVVKWGHTEGIERDKTLSQKYTVIALNFWRDEFFLVFQIWGQNTIGGQFLGHYHLIWNCPWFLKRFLIFQIWGYYLQKVNAKCPQISDKKDKFFFYW